MTTDTATEPTTTLTLDRDELEALLAAVDGTAIANVNAIRSAGQKVLRGMDRLDPARTPTCADRLPSHLAGRLDDFRAMLGRDDPEEPGEDIDEPGRLSEYPLGASVGYSVRIELSTGGPADYITATVDVDGDVTAAQYHFADWFDHAEQALDGDELETVARFVTELYGGDLAYALNECAALERTRR